MSNFRHNHYVPEWYQQRFLPPGQGKFTYLDLSPEVVTTASGHTYTRKDKLEWGPTSCFAQDDLYTTGWGDLVNVDIEKFFFGEIDTRGKDAVEFFDDFDIKAGMHDAFEHLIRYLSVQKLRTPKGLGHVAGIFRISDRNLMLQWLQRIQNIFAATWTDAVWQIASAETSETKFIISDHPVTVYNRGCFPGSKHCEGFGDPDIRYVATHTYFPLSMNSVLVLTNLSWVRNPYQKETRKHPNQTLFRNTMFNATDVQVGRSLTEEEVRQFNYITKMRALRYVAAAKEEWLFPERFLESTNWRQFGDGLLMMPEPRAVHMGGETFVGYENGHTEAFGEYGHRPGQKGYKDDARHNRESSTLRRFQDEFALMQGPLWRGWPIDHFGRSGPQEDSAEYFESQISRVRDKKWLRKYGRAHGL